MTHKWSNSHSFFSSSRFTDSLNRFLDEFVDQNILEFYTHWPVDERLHGSYKRTFCDHQFQVSFYFCFVNVLILLTKFDLLCYFEKFTPLCCIQYNSRVDVRYTSTNFLSWWSWSSTYPLPLLFVSSLSHKHTIITYFLSCVVVLFS
jgi:hypothetical protein